MGKCEAKQWDRRGQDLRWVKIVFLLACLSVMFVLNYTSILQKTFTYDEPWHPSKQHLDLSRVPSNAPQPTCLFRRSMLLRSCCSKASHVRKVRWKISLFD